MRSLGFPGGSDGKESTCNARDLGSIPGWRRSPGERNSDPLQYLACRIPWTERSLLGYSLWGRKESDTNERLNTDFSIRSLLKRHYSDLLAEKFKHFSQDGCK